MKSSINNLPLKVQSEVREILRSYNSVSVWFEYGEYHVSTGACIKAQYGADRKDFGTIIAAEVYTADERIENYCNSFADYPVNYKGTRDYSIMHDIKNSGYTKKVKLENGNIVLA